MAKFKYFEEAVAAFDLNNYVSIDSFINKDDGYKSCPKELSIQATPEDFLLARENENELNSLSEEAKQVISILTDCPKEIFEAMGYKYDKQQIGLSAIKKYFKWPNKKFKQIIGEVKEYALCMKGE